MSPRVHEPRQRSRALELLVRAVAAAGLAVDAYIHLALAGTYDANTGDLVGQGALFRIEAAVAIVAAVLVLAVRRRATDVLVLAVAGSAAVVALVYRYVDLGPVLGLPNMYEPVWYPEKVITTVAEILAALATVTLIRPPRP